MKSSAITSQWRCFGCGYHFLFSLDQSCWNAGFSRRCSKRSGHGNARDGSGNKSFGIPEQKWHQRTESVPEATSSRAVCYGVCLLAFGGQVNITSKEITISNWRLLCFQNGLGIGKTGFGRRQFPEETARIRERPHSGHHLEKTEDLHTEQGFCARKGSHRVEGLQEHMHVGARHRHVCEGVQNCGAEERKVWN